MIDHSLVQDYWREWHVVARPLGHGRYMTVCQRVVAEREPVPLLDVPGEGLQLCARCREIQAVEGGLAGSLILQLSTGDPDD